MDDPFLQKQYCITVPGWKNLPYHLARVYADGLVLEDETLMLFDSIDDAVEKAQECKKNLQQYDFEIREFLYENTDPALRWYRGPWEMSAQVYRTV